MYRLVAWICAALLTITMVATPAAAEQDGGVPAGFMPSSTSWIGDNTGFVLGFAPCADKRCPALVQTFDGGATWRPLTAPSVPLISVDRRARVRFANAWDGVI